VVDLTGAVRRPRPGARDDRCGADHGVLAHALEGGPTLGHARVGGELGVEHWSHLGIEVEVRLLVRSFDCSFV